MQKKILYVYGLAIILGVLTGLLGSVFQLVILWLNSTIILLFDWLKLTNFSVVIGSILLSTTMILVAWLLVKKFAPEAAGSGVQEVEGALLHIRPIKWRYLLPIKFIGGILAICSKLVVGREGPIIQMGGNLGAMLGEVANIKKSRKDTLIAAGAAAGLATAFNAPLAGVLFVVEELRNTFNYNFINFKMIAICCIAATITTQLIFGSTPAIPMTIFKVPNLNYLWLFFIFGIVAGFAGLLFNHLLINRLYFMDTLSVTQRLIYIVIVGVLVGGLAIVYPSVVGGGYEIIQQALTLSLSLNGLLIVGVLRFITTIACYTVSVPGGIFAPMLALGTILGLIFFQIVHLIFPSIAIDANIFAVAGMGALFSACIRAPLTGIVLIVEMTGNYFLILPLMVCCLTSTTVMQLAKNEPIYTQLLRRTIKTNSV